jgi:hypothetical protein
LRRYRYDTLRLIGWPLYRVARSRQGARARRSGEESEEGARDPGLPAPAD